MPNLTPVTITQATANGANPRLDSSEALQLVQNGQVIVTLSAPVGGDSFRVCTYAPSCWRGATARATRRATLD